MKTDINRHKSSVKHLTPGKPSSVGNDAIYIVFIFKYGIIYTYKYKL